MATKDKINTLWLHYDLGIRGDYDALYAWLDQHKAKECGDSLAVFKFSYRRDLQKEITAELERLTQGHSSARFYVIYRDPESNKNKGFFARGGRRASPWEGFSPASTPTADIEE